MHDSERGRKKGCKHRKVLRTNAHNSGAKTFALHRGQLAPLLSIPRAEQSKVTSCDVNRSLLISRGEFSLGNRTAVNDGSRYITPS